MNSESHTEYMDEQEFRQVIEDRHRMDEKEWHDANSEEKGHQLDDGREEEMMERMFLLNTIKRLEKENEELKQSQTNQRE